MPALPSALSKTYCTRANVLFDTSTNLSGVAKNFFWMLKAALMNQLTGGTFTGTRHANSVWTCVGSSDGVTAALDGVDRWGSTFDRSKIVQAASSSPHSWIILQNSTLGMRILIDCNSATVSNARIAATASALPWTLAVNPLHSPLPSSPTNQGFMLGSSAIDAASTSVQYFYYNSDATSAYYSFFGHFTFTDDGQFFWLTNRSGDGFFSSGAAFVRSTGANVSDGFQYYLIGGTNNQVPPWPNGSTINTASFTIGLSVLGGASDGGINIWNFGGTSHVSIATFSDQFSSEVNFYTPHIWSTGRHAYRGYIADMYMMIGGRSGVLIPNSSAPLWISLNRMIWPWVGEAPKL